MKLLLAGLAIVFFCSIFSCTKTNNVKTTVYDTTIQIVRDTVWEKTPKNPIVGLWEGKYLNNGLTDSNFYSFDIQANGNCIATAIGSTNNSDATSGPWQLAGTTFTATLTELTIYTPEIQNVTATYDSTTGTLSGSWQVQQGSGSNGTFTLTRIP